MSSPVEERRGFNTERGRSTSSPKHSGDDEGTIVGESSTRHSPHTGPLRSRSTHLTVNTDYHHNLDDIRSTQSPSRSRQEAHRLDDDLTMLKVERMVSQEAQSRPSHSAIRSTTRRDDPPDDFDLETDPIHNKPSVYTPPKNPNTSVGRMFKKIHESIWLVRYFTYIVPIACLILIPLLLAAFVFKRATVGGVRLMWFCIWLEIIWLSLWAGRILAKCLPWPIGVVTSMFTNNSKKWRDMGKQLEIPATLFFWGLAVEVSFLPVMKNNHLDGNTQTREWQRTMNKVLISVFVALILNFAEKIIIQLIAISFHLRTYADRIDINKFQISSLVKLYQYSKENIDVPDYEFAEKSGANSGTRTPGKLVKEAQKNTMGAVKKLGDIAGKAAGDFTGKDVVSSSHPHQVVLTLLSTTEGSQALARRLYRTFCVEGAETVSSDDLRPAFVNDEEADAAFTMFDKDLNGDISIEELEAVCVEIGRERKSITASLKDLDSVVSKLDDVFIFIICVITVLVFISLISTSAAGVLTSAGSSVLALSWLFSATAQEFLQSIIFVFVKHPFDVGDRVTIYGNTGAALKGDDYFVKEIALLYTEFKKMQGHVVQAPNSYLNTLFILNQRRSGGLAEALPVVIKFGTTLEQMEMLRARLLEFVKSEKREFAPNVLTELVEVCEAHSLTLNVVFFYKSNWQNELLRLQRRNKFICALMVSIQELGIEGPRMRYPGQKESFPVYLQNIPHSTAMPASSGAPPMDPNNPADAPFVERDPTDRGKEAYGRDYSVQREASSSRHRGESLAQMGRRVDFSLGMKDVSSADLTGDIFEDRPVRLPPRLSSPVSGRGSFDRARRSSDAAGRSTSISHVSGILHRNGGNNNLTRVPTDGSMARERSVHRNRFWSRGRNQEEDERMEIGMAGIPEDNRLDPRSGRVSPAAWRSSVEEPRSPTQSKLR